jgi:polyisoprenyl-phosphate glycosyltransferase
MQLSIVIPILNEEEVLEHLVHRLRESCARLQSWEVIFVDDGSTDNTRAMLRSLCRGSEHFRTVFLSRNFGHQVAISAGMRYASGERVVIMDGDLQDPPELIPELVATMAQGYDVVYALRASRAGSPLKNLSYWLFYRLAKRLTEVFVPVDAGDFCILSRRVVNVLNAMPEKKRYLRGMRAWVGFAQGSVEFNREDRHFGRPKYTWSKLLHLALDGIFTMSEAPLRFATVIGALFSLLAFAYGMWLVIWRLSTNEPLVGFATLAVTQFLFFGLTLLFLGVIGEYIARIHTEVKNRPLYLVSETHNLVVDDDAGGH